MFRYVRERGNERQRFYRFRMVERAHPERFKKFLEESEEAARRRYVVYKQLAGISVPAAEATPAELLRPAQTWW